MVDESPPSGFQAARVCTRPFNSVGPAVNDGVQRLHERQAGRASGGAPAARPGRWMEGVVSTAVMRSPLRSTRASHLSSKNSSQAMGGPKSGACNRAKAAVANLVKDLAPAAFAIDGDLQRRVFDDDESIGRYVRLPRRGLGHAPTADLIAGLERQPRHGRLRLHFQLRRAGLGRRDREAKALGGAPRRGA